MNETGRIISIHDIKPGNGATFRRVTFVMDDGKWAKTDCCPSFRNYANWKDLIKVGNVLGGLVRRDPKTIDADCKPVFIRHEEYIAPALPQPVVSPQLQLL